MSYQWKNSLALTALFALAACDHSKPASQAPVDLSPVPVKTIVAGFEPLAHFEEVAGTVQPKLRALIEAKVSGRIQSMPARLGQKVSRGDLLAELESNEIQARVEQAAASREQAATDLKRINALFQQQAATQADFDAAQSRSRVAEAALREAGTLLAYAKVVSPFDGVVVRKLADVGDLANPGKPLLELHDPENMRFIAEVPDSLIAHIKSGAQLQVKIAGHELVNASVVEIAPGGDPVARTSRVELDLPPNQFRSGVFGRLLVPSEAQLSLFVPASAIRTRGQLEQLFVVNANRLQLRLVKTGKQLGDKIEILSGLSSGERIVIEINGSLRDGQPVTNL